MPSIEQQTRNTPFEAYEDIMTNFLRILPIILLTGVIGSCASNSSNSVILPNINVTNENIGKGKHIVLFVNDLRTDKTVGFMRKNDELQPIPSRQQVADVIYYQMIEAMKAKGFVVDSHINPGEPSLTLQIDELKYTVQPNFLTSDLVIDTNFKAIVANGGATLTKGYQEEKKIKDFSIGATDRDHKRMTATISAALTDLVNDNQILNALAGNRTGAVTPQSSGPVDVAPQAPGSVEGQPLPN